MYVFTRQHCQTSLACISGPSTAAKEFMVKPSRAARAVVIAHLCIKALYQRKNEQSAYRK